MTKADAREAVNHALDVMARQGRSITICPTGPRRGLTAHRGRPIRRIV